MTPLSLTPRYDLFRFCLPKDFLPDDVETKYRAILARNAGVIVSPIEYLNESIKGVHIPGINDLVMEQSQHGLNPIERQSANGRNLGRINVETQHTLTYTSAVNPLDKIEKEIRVTFRMNQGLYNYYMLYETIFNHYCKHINMDPDSALYIELLDETGKITGRIVMTDIRINGMDGLDLSYDKSTRNAGTFDIAFKFNNINFEFLPEDEDTI